MNTKQFMVLFASVALMNVVNGTFGEGAVISGLGVYLPLLAGTAGSLSLPLAVLGVLKLAAAVKLAGGLSLLNLKGGEPQYEEASSSYDSRRHYARAQQYRGHRNKRDAEHNEAVFSLVSTMDMYSCGKALVCGLEAKDPQSLSQDEQMIMALFADRKEKKHYVNPSSAKAEYELAAELGLATKDEVACRKRYNTCPYTADEMMSVLRNSQL